MGKTHMRLLVLSEFQNLSIQVNLWVGLLSYLFGRRV